MISEFATFKQIKKIHYLKVMGVPILNFGICVTYLKPVLKGLIDNIFLNIENKIF